MLCYACSRFWTAQPVCAYTGGPKTEPHEEVEGGAGLAPRDVHAAAAVMQHPLTQVSALLHLLLEQQVSKLEETRVVIRHPSLGTFTSSLAGCWDVVTSVWTSQEPGGLTWQAP